MELRPKHNDAILRIVSIHSERKANLDHMRVCAGIIITAMQKMPETPNKTV